MIVDANLMRVDCSVEYTKCQPGARCLRRYVYQMETGEEARLAAQIVELPADASVSFLKRRLERISFGGHQLASSQQVCRRLTSWPRAPEPSACETLPPPHDFVRGNLVQIRFIRVP